FMGEALKGKPEIHRPQPPGSITVRINPETGARVRPGDPSRGYEYFLNDQNTPNVMREQPPGHEEGAPPPEHLVQPDEIIAGEKPEPGFLTSLQDWRRSRSRTI